MISRGMRRGGRSASVAPPAGLGWTPADLAVRYLGGGRYDGHVHTAGRIPTTSQVMYLARNGNNASSGLTPALAKRSLWSIWNAIGATPTRVIAEAGEYDLAHGWSGGGGGTGLTADVVMEVRTDLENPASTGVATSSVRTLGLVWANAGGGTPNVWQTAGVAAAPYAVVDDRTRDVYGCGRRLSLVADVATVNTTPGSYFYGAGTLSVRLPDDRQPDNYVAPYRNLVNALVNIATRRLACSGWRFKGGSRAFLMTRILDGLFVGCSFDDANLEGFGLSNVADVLTPTLYAIDCQAVNNGADGFQYTASKDTSVTHALELRCRGLGNGWDGSNINNGSTTHSTTGANASTMRSIRIGGRYQGNQGPNIADAGTPARSWNLGCIADGTRATIDAQRVNYWTAGEAYLDGCTLSGNVTDLHADGAGGRIYQRATRYRASRTAGGGQFPSY